MNIKIQKSEFDWLMRESNLIYNIVIGSRMYGTSEPDSDTDVFTIYGKEFFFLLTIIQTFTNFNTMMLKITNNGYFRPEINSLKICCLEIQQ